jgi:hypothetical protein
MPVIFLCLAEPAFLIIVTLSPLLIYIVVFLFNNKIYENRFNEIVNKCSFFKLEIFFQNFEGDATMFVKLLLVKAVAEKSFLVFRLRENHFSSDLILG